MHMQIRSLFHTTPTHLAEEFFSTDHIEVGHDLVYHCLFDYSVDKRKHVGR